jgi:hypothetical protein
LIIWYATFQTPSELVHFSMQRHFVRQAIMELAELLSCWEKTPTLWASFIFNHCASSSPWNVTAHAPLSRNQTIHEMAIVIEAQMNAWQVDIHRIEQEIHENFPHLLLSSIETDVSESCEADTDQATCIKQSVALLAPIVMQQAALCESDINFERFLIWWTHHQHDTIRHALQTDVALAQQRELLNTELEAEIAQTDEHDVDALRTLQLLSCDIHHILFEAAKTSCTDAIANQQSVTATSLQSNAMAMRPLYRNIDHHNPALRHVAADERYHFLKNEVSRMEVGTEN